MQKYTKIIDTHAHYESEQFDEDRWEVINSLFEGNILALVNISTSLENFKKSLEIANNHEFIYTSLGYHPEYTNQLDDEKFEELSKYATDNKVVTIGEIGLDYYWDTSKPETQKYWFEKHIELALKHNLPINIHSRDAAKDTFDLLHKYYGKKTILNTNSFSTSDCNATSNTDDNKSSTFHPGIVHCFSYSKELALDAINMGFKLGIGGVITFTNAKKLVEVINEVSLKDIVLETDCPYLAPVPYRGKRNISSNLQLVAEQIAKIKEITVEEVIDITTKNALEVYSKIKLN